MNRDNVDSLSRETECLMCLNQANDARMCIHCSAIVCAKCIETWINLKNSCPKCFHSVQLTDFVKCRLANRLIDFIETTNTNNCSIHPKEIPRVLCLTCQEHICSICISTNGEHVNHEYDNSDEDYRKISTINSKLLDLIRRRWKENQDNLKTIELAIEMLLNDSIENDQRTDSLIKETERLFDDYHQKKQMYMDVIKSDESIINDVERRLKESRSLSSQEDILQRLQRHIPSKSNQ